METWREMGDPRAASPILCEDQRRLGAEQKGKGLSGKQPHKRSIKMKGRSPVAPTPR